MLLGRQFPVVGDAQILPLFPCPSHLMLSSPVPVCRLVDGQVLM